MDLEKLEKKVDDLIRLCDKLQQENTHLRNQNAQNKAVQTDLTKRNALARTRMESMIKRLKSLEVEL